MTGYDAALVDGSGSAPYAYTNPRPTGLNKRENLVAWTPARVPSRGDRRQPYQIFSPSVELLPQP